jgi:hypothetical protein
MIIQTVLTTMDAATYNINTTVKSPVSSSEDLSLTDLVTWGSSIYSVGGLVNSAPFSGSRIYNPTATGSGIWTKITNGSLISGSRYSTSTLLVPASMIPNLPAGCVGL